MTEAVQQSLINAIPTIIGSLAAAWVVIWRSNKKTVEQANQTNELVAHNTNKLDDVHQTVNGNFTALQAKHDALATENQALREQIAQRAAKRATDP